MYISYISIIKINISSIYILHIFNLHLVFIYPIWNIFTSLFCVTFIHTSPRLVKFLKPAFERHVLNCEIFLHDKLPSEELWEQLGSKLFTRDIYGGSESCKLNLMFRKISSNFSKRLGNSIRWNCKYVTDRSSCSRIIKIVSTCHLPDWAHYLRPLDNGVSQLIFS